MSNEMSRRRMVQMTTLAGGQTPRLRKAHLVSGRRGVAEHRASAGWGVARPGSEGHDDSPSHALNSDAPSTTTGGAGRISASAVKRIEVSTAALPSAVRIRRVPLKV